MKVQYKSTNRECCVVSIEERHSFFNSKLLKVTLIRGATPLAAARHIFLQRVTERNFCLCRHRPQGQNDFVYIKPDGKYKVNYQ